MRKREFVKNSCVGICYLCTISPDFGCTHSGFLTVWIASGEKKFQLFLFFVPKLQCKLNYFQYLCVKSIFRPMKKDINRLKLVLVERKRTGKWLAEQLGKDPSTVSKWCSNTTQPSLDILVNIAKVLEVDVKQLINE